MSVGKRKFVLLRGPKVRRKLPALAAQLRAFSSLLSLPSRAQSVIKAFRRQGIGVADVINTARFLLSRLESLFASQKVFQIFRGRAEARLCDLFRSAVAPLHKSHRLAKARFKGISVVMLSDCRARAGKTVISRPNLSASGSCRALRACPPYVICRQFPHPLSRTRKPPSNTIGQRELTDASASVQNSASCPARRVCLWIYVWGCETVLQGSSHVPLSYL